MSPEGTIRGKVLSERRPFYFYLTEREEDFRIQTLREHLYDLKAGAITQDEARHALSDVCVLIGKRGTIDFVSVEVLDRLVDIASPLPTQVHGAHHVIEVERYTFYLSWDRKIRGISGIKGGWDV